MATFVFILCALTSLACSVLLLRAYRRTRIRLLLWSGICFTGLTLNNVLVFLDLVVIPDVSLILFRKGAVLASLMMLVVALVWETNRSAP